MHSGETIRVTNHVSSGEYGIDLDSVIFESVSWIEILSILCEIVPRWTFAIKHHW